MDLYQEILAYALWQHGIQMKIPEFHVEPRVLVDGVCYQALTKQGIFTSRHDFG